MTELGTGLTYDRLHESFDPVRAELLARVDPKPGEKVLDLATGAGEMALLAAATGADVSAIDLERALVEQARERAVERGLTVAFGVGDVEYLPYEDACFDVLLSNFGLIFCEDHANVASELARVTRDGGRVGFTAWTPDEKLGALYSRFGGDEPIAGREVYEWGRPEHVEDMLAEDFELELDDGTLWLDAASGEEIWQFFSEAAPPVIALCRRLDDATREEFHRAFVELYEGYRDGDRVRAPRAYLLVYGRRR